MKIEILLNALDEMIVILNSSGKKESADFFSLKYSNIKNSQNPLKFIEELSKCRAMAQYANFSLVEENKLDSIIELTVDILKKK